MTDIPGMWASSEDGRCPVAHSLSFGVTQAGVVCEAILASQLLVKTRELCPRLPGFLRLQSRRQVTTAWPSCWEPGSRAPSQLCWRLLLKGKRELKFPQLPAVIPAQLT